MTKSTQGMKARGQFVDTQKYLNAREDSDSASVNVLEGLSVVSPRK